MKLLPQTFRRRRNLWAAAASEAGAPLLRLLVQSRIRLPASPPCDWRRVLLLGANHIGDILYTTASLPHLASGLPDCRWFFAASPPADQIIETNPYVSGVVRLNGEPLKAALQRGRFDAAICYNSGAYAGDLLSVTRGGIPNRIGYVHKGFSALVTHPIQIEYPQAYPAYFRDLVGQLTGQTPAWDLRPFIAPDIHDEKEAEEFCERHDLKSADSILACFVTTRQPTGTWPGCHFAETLQRVRERTGARIVLCGAAADEAKLEELKRSEGLDCIVNAGQMRLRALAAFLRECRAVLCTDSGPRHIANAAGVPVFYFRNLRSSRVETGNYCETETDLSPDGEYIPASLQQQVLAQITPKSVAGRIIPLFESAR